MDTLSWDVSSSGDLPSSKIVPGVVQTGEVKGTAPAATVPGEKEG